MVLDRRVVRLAGDVGEFRVDRLLRHVFVFRSLVLEVQLRDAVHDVEVANDDVAHDIAACANDKPAREC